MSKQAILSEVLALADKDQKEILSVLHARWGTAVVLSAMQMRELDRRIEQFERDGSKGEKWESVEKQLRKNRVHARYSH